MASVAFDAIYVSYIYRVYLIPLIISASNKSLSQKNSVNFASYVGPWRWASGAGGSLGGALPCICQGRGREQLWQSQRSATDLHFKRICGFLFTGVWFGICSSGISPVSLLCQTVKCVIRLQMARTEMNRNLPGLLSPQKSTSCLFCDVLGAFVDDWEKKLAFPCKFTNLLHHSRTSTTYIPELPFLRKARVPRS